MSTSLVEPKIGVAGEAEPSGRPVVRARRRRRLRGVIEPMGGTRTVSAAFGGLLATALWIAMFTVGLAVPSAPFRDGLFALAGGTPAPGAYRVESWLDAMYALSVIAFSYTPTNLAMLCCLAALIGCLAYTATQNGEPARESPEPMLVKAGAARPRADVDVGGDKAAKGEEVEVIPLRPAISAVTWGFFIYLFLISGTLLTSQSPFSATTPDQYLRLAGTASLLAFVVGWRPELITRLVTQIGQTRISSQGGPTGPKE